MTPIKSIKKSKKTNPEVTEVIEKSFFQLQTEGIGFDPEKDFSQYSLHPDEPFGKKAKQELFWEDKDGNVCIGVMDLSGDLITYDAKDSKSRIQIKPICIKRIKAPKDDNKYLPESTGWGTFPYPTHTVINAFKEKKTLKKLVIVEGFKKAFAIHKKLGVPAIGIPGITQWKGKKDVEIYSLIKDVVQTCNVSELIFLTDADTLQVQYRSGKDLYKRPFQFYQAVLKFKELTKDFDIDCYFAHIKLEYVKTAKGFDDLLNVAENHDDLRSELLNISGQKNYIQKLSVSAKSHAAIKDYFFISNPYDANKFYKEYEHEIGLERFIYNQAEFQYDDKTGELVCHKSAAASQFIMIQTTIYMKGAKPTFGGRAIENVIMPTTKDAIRIMHNNSKPKLDRILSEIEYFHGAWNFPSHTNYQYFFTTEDGQGNAMRWYNMYRPVTHEPSNGECHHSIAMVKHIFGSNKIIHKGREIFEYDLGFDYIKLLWEMPSHYLPILVLGSEERRTGKTTFWDWMRNIFQQNARTIEGDELGKQFTSYYASALLVIIEEAMFEKRQTIERIKEMVTAKKTKLEAKHQDAQEIDNCLHIGISTNNIRTFANIDGEETRFWIRKVNQIPQEKKDFDLLEKLTEEIPYFLNYIQERDMVTEREDRAWFHEDLIKTPELEAIKLESRWNYEIILEEAIMEHMSRVKKGVIKLAQNDIKELTPGTVPDRNLVRKVLQHRWKLSPTKTSAYYKTYTWMAPDDMNPDGTIQVHKKSSIYYTIFCDQFFDVDEYLTFITDVEDLIELEHEQKNKGKTSFFELLKKDQILMLGKKLDPGINDDEILNYAVIGRTYKDFSSHILNKTPF